MSRIRSIKPELNDDEAVACLSSDAWRLWVSMWTLSDDEGNCRANPRQLSAKIFWGWTPVKPIEELLEELVSARRIHLYEVAGERFAHVRNWKKHQKIEKPQPGKVPPPPSPPLADSVPASRDSTTVPRLVADRSDDDPEPFGEPSSNGRGAVAVGREGKGRDRKGMDPTRGGARGAGSDGDTGSSTPAPERPPHADPSMLAGAYREGASAGKREVTGDPNAAVDPDALAWRDVKRMVDAHAPRDLEDGQAVLDWVREIARAYVLAMWVKREFHAGFHPKKCVEWLNAGRPAASAPGPARAGPPVQPRDPSAPWIRAAEEDA